MKRSRYYLLALNIAGVLGFGLFTSSAQETTRSPYQEPILSRYDDFYRAQEQNDIAKLVEVAEQSSGYLQFRSFLSLGRNESIPATTRYSYLLRALNFFTDDPLARSDRSALWLEAAENAERAGLTNEAVEAYAEALPEDEARDALYRLQPNPYRLANYFLQARMHSDAIKALEGRSAPSIEAPAYRRIGEYGKALNAYERWLREQPGDPAALEGRAWMLLLLNRNAEAAAALREQGGPDESWGLGTIALRRGDVDEAVRLYRQSGVPKAIWQATEVLESRGRSEDAIPVYLHLARTDSSYADDAAYRALVLAQRYGQAEAEAQARRLLPDYSFFRLRAGEALQVPQSSSLPSPDLPVLELANALARAGDVEAAIGELTLALWRAEDEATTVTIAEAMQRLGEFRESQRAAEVWLRAGSTDLRTWRASYPQAYPEVVASQAAARELDPELLWAVMHQESRFYPKAVSVANAKGVMQFIPSTWVWMAELLREAPGDPFDPPTNIRYGATYLRWLLDYFDDDLERAVPSYNGGQGYIRRLFSSQRVGEDRSNFYRFIDKSETREYLQKVLLGYEIYKALY